MIQKYTIIKYLVILSSASFLLHLLTYQTSIEYMQQIIKFPVTYLSSYRYDTQFNRTKLLFNLSNDESMHSLNLFLDKVVKYEIDVFLIEPAILSSVTNVRTTVITFGLHGNHQTKVSLFDQFRNDNFQVLTLTVNNATAYEFINKTLPSHIFLFNKLILIHVVVFYKRANNFIWSDAVELDHKTKPAWLDKDKLTFGEHANSFKSIDIEEVDFGNRTLYRPMNTMGFVKEFHHSRFLECNYSRAALYYKQNNISPKPSSWAINAVKMLEKTEMALSPIGVPFWLSSGSMLGWYRQCGIIPYTTDVDIEIKIDDYTDDIYKSLIQIGFSHIYTFGKLNDSFEYTFNWNGVKMDIFFVYEDKDNFWIGGTNGKNKLRFIHPKFNICWTELLSIRVRVPCEAEKYVLANYGKKWNIPIKTWSWVGDAANVKHVGKWT